MSAIPLPPMPPEKTSTTQVDPGYRDPHRLCEQAVRQLTAERDRLRRDVEEGAAIRAEREEQVRLLCVEQDRLRDEGRALAARLAQAERVVEAARAMAGPVQQAGLDEAAQDGRDHRRCRRPRRYGRTRRGGQ